ncbi:lipopolysaccharide biosynthesis protein [Marinobacter sp.]|uniref:lipopolysaccharide biosynthesis protein n=1 Tax=Marinobacter sp. TaxID=50741 RepID=UPI0035C7118A
MNRLKSAVLQRVPKSRFVRSVSILAGGTAAGQLIVIAASPILTRLYSPEDFGMLAVYGGVLGILGVIASLRYQLAIPLPDTDREALHIVALSLLIVGLMTGIVWLAVVLAGQEFVALLNTPELAEYLWLLPVGLFLVGVFQVLQYWAIRVRAFSTIARTSVSQSVGMVLVQVGGYAIGPVMLLVGRVVGQSAGIVSLSQLLRGNQAGKLTAVSAAQMKDVGSRYRNFPMVSTWTGLANSAGANLPPVLIAVFLGGAAAGLFALAHRVLSQPMAVIGQAISDAFYQQAVEANRNGQLYREVQRLYSTLIPLALPLALTNFLVVPELFVLIFGDAWAQAGEVARWMTPWLFFQFVVSPCTGIYPIIDRHDIALRFQLSLLASSVLGIVIGGIVFGSLVWVVGVISVLNSGIYLWRLVTTVNVVGGRILDPIYCLLKAVPVSLLVNAPLVTLILYSDGESALWALMSSVFMVLALWFFLCGKKALKGFS